jgi:hypothetical protein
MEKHRTSRLGGGATIGLLTRQRLLRGQLWCRIPGVWHDGWPCGLQFSRKRFLTFLFNFAYPQHMSGIIVCPKMKKIVRPVFGGSPQSKRLLDIWRSYRGGSRVAVLFCQYGYVMLCYVKHNITWLKFDDFSNLDLDLNLWF